MEHEAPVTKEGQALYEAADQGYASWHTSELVECAKRCIAELERRGWRGAARPSIRQRLKFLFAGEA